MDAFNKCPKCGHERRPDEKASPEQCPACGIYFSKWVGREKFIPPSLQKAIADEGDEEAYGWYEQLRDRIFHVPAEIDSLNLYSRAATLLFLLVWGVVMARMDYRDGEMGSSFMHAILLPIHEAGHVIFMPFGEFMTILGGSLFQILFPLIVAAALLWTNRDACGAAIGTWWASASLIDLAPYIYDAKAPTLILLTGETGEDGPHDWIFLLGKFGKVHRSQAYGAWAHHLGVVFMLISILAAAAVLWRWHKARAAARSKSVSDTMQP